MQHLRLSNLGRLYLDSTKQPNQNRASLLSLQKRQVKRCKASTAPQRTSKMMADCLQDKCCLVTGGSKGIGKAIVHSLAKYGARVYTCARDSHELNQAVGSFRAESLDGCVCDVTDDAALKELVKKASDLFGGKLHALVNNAGTGVRRRALDVKQEEYELQMKTNVDAVFKLTNLCHPLLSAAGEASVVFVTSISGGPRANPSGAVYGMTKAALNQCARNLACEWATDGIRVNCVAPGFVRTPLNKEYFDNQSNFDMTVKETPMKRLGTPEDISGAVAFFCSNESRFITGQTLVVDGGFSVRGCGY